MALAGGPDHERPVSLESGRCVVAALREAGYDAVQRDIGPDNLAALDEFTRWGGDAIFPAMHGQWGEGGPLQRLLDARGIAYAGTRGVAAERCIDKYETKLVLAEHGIATPAFEVIGPSDSVTIEPPLVIKAPREGSSIDLVICRDADHAVAARGDLEKRHNRLLVERFVAGNELTVGVIAGPDGDTALPVIRIVPPGEFYDYESKYESDQTQYLLDADQIGLTRAALADIQAVALRAHAVLGCRHMSRVDVIVDDAGQPWVLEVNTIPGFTEHSLLPKAAAHAGIELPQLVDRLVRLAIGDGSGGTADAQAGSGTIGGAASAD